MKTCATCTNRRGIECTLTRRRVTPWHRCVSYLPISVRGFAWRHIFTIVASAGAIGTVLGLAAAGVR